LKLKHFNRWFNEIQQRPAVERGLSVLASLRKPAYDAQAKDILFGKQQYQR
jgi:GST-like protein